MQDEKTNIKYIIEKTKNKNVYICIKEGKVILKLPYRVKITEANKIIESKKDWIIKKLEEDRKKQKIEAETGEYNFDENDIERLRKIVDKDIKKYSELMKIAPKKVRIRNIKYAWGSCSSNQNITINMKLAKKEEKIIEYVVLHEMAHLTYMNHSKDFWKLVEKYMPDYKIYQERLKK